MKNAVYHSEKLVWPELIKMTALVWIFINHLAEVRFGYPFIANPSSNWPPLADRIAQLQPITGFGYWDILLNFWRYVGWSGDQGVQLFLIISGFGLSWGLLAKYGKTPFKISNFYLRRGERIFPLWWGAHFLFIAILAFTGYGLSPYSISTYLSFAGIRVTPELIYYFSPAWWYISLIIQLYLFFPVLWYFLRRWGAARLLLASCVIAFLIRLAGLYYFDGYLDAWARGAIFITRLPEFVFGICFALWLLEKPAELERRLKGVLPLMVLATGYIIGNLLSLTLGGMAVAPFITGVCAFLLLYKLFKWCADWVSAYVISPFVWLGKHSYSLFLVHHPIILAFMTPGILVWHESLFLISASIAATVLLGVFLEKTVDIATHWILRWHKSFGFLKLAAAAFVGGSLFAGLFVGAELAVRRYDPQEVAGWGERESLEPHSDFGWRLIPSKTTRLRWLSYDYTVNANSLGFPGPEPKIEKAADVFRIMVTGDAFSSAEGVDTEQAWPRLLEFDLNEKLSGKKVEVLNFAITGYGPNQYKAVIGKFAPVYKPDLIIVETFVNDFQDVLKTDDSFRSSIGFGDKLPNGVKSIVRLEHLRRWMDLNLLQPAKEIFSVQPRSEGYALANLRALERGHADYEIEGKEKFAERLQSMRSVAAELDAKVVIVSIPASTQVCTADQLLYFPKGVKISDATRFDVDLPQRMTRELAERFEFPIFDLREAFSGGQSECPYQPRNMHWTVQGHRTAAKYLTENLLTSGLIH